MFRHRSSKIVSFIAALFALVCMHSLWAADSTSGSVEGVVKDSSGAPVAGAFVKLKNADRRLVFMVISQAQGRYTANNLPAGKYVVQGVGGEKQSEMSAPLDVAAGGKATADLSLTADRAPALPNAWPGRQPGQGGGEGESGGGALPPLPDGAGKQVVMTKCSTCHDYARIVNGRFEADRWKDIIEEMRAYMQGSTMSKDLTDQEAKDLLDYVAEKFTGTRAGRAAPPVPDPNSRLPRTLLKGAEAKYIAVEYTLPNAKAEPHEVAADIEGNGWVTQRTGGRLGKFDVKTLVYTEMDPPKAKEKNRLNGIVRAPDGKLWFLDGGPNRRWLTYDTKTREFNVYALPKLKSGAASGNTMRVHPNGTVWLNSIAANQVIRLNPLTKDFTVFDVPSGVKTGKSANPYGMAIDGAGNVWFVENNMNKVGRINPDTGKIDEYDVPLANAVPRKAGMDSEGNVLGRASWRGQAHEDRLQDAQDDHPTILRPTMPASIRCRAIPRASTSGSANSRPTRSPGSIRKHRRSWSSRCRTRNRITEGSRSTRSIRTASGGPATFPVAWVTSNT